MTPQMIIPALALVAVLVIGVWVVLDHLAHNADPEGDGLAELVPVVDEAGRPVGGQMWACGRAAVPPRSHHAGTVYIHRRRR